MKTCGKCLEPKPISEYSKKSEGKLQAYCKPCNRLYQKEHYKRNKAKYSALTRSTRKVIKATIHTLKESSPCMDCGVSYPYWVMDFDHVDGTKVNTIAQLCNRRASLGAILNEIAKCELVCSNCHRIRTHARFIAS